MPRGELEKLFAKYGRERVNAAVTNLLTEAAKQGEYCPTCRGLWPDFCSCPDRDDEVEQRDRFANGESAYDGEF